MARVLGCRSAAAPVSASPQALDAVELANLDDQLGRILRSNAKIEFVDEP